MQSALSILLMILGAVYVLVLPGLALSFAFFRRGRIDVIERAALSFALSIAVVPLLVFYLNLAGVKISRTSVLIEVAVVIVAALIIASSRPPKAPASPVPQSKTPKPAPPVRPKPTPPRPKRRIQF
jgi:uncharacterized membrane protein